MAGCQEQFAKVSSDKQTDTLPGTVIGEIAYISAEKYVNIDVQFVLENILNLWYNRYI